LQGVVVLREVAFGIMRECCAGHGGNFMG
jgi:hypothetical protein